MQRSVLLVATTTGYQVRSFTDAAARAGVRLVLATDRCGSLEDPWRDAAIPVRFHDERGALAAIDRAAARTPFSGVLAVGDRPAALAAAAACRLGLPGHPPEAARDSRNKRRTRERLRDAGLPQPWFQAVPIETDPSGLDVSFPCVVKPLVLSGSRGVMRADTREAFDRAFARLVRLLRSREVQVLRDPDAGTVLVETYLPGTEYAIEAALDHGRLRILAMFDKPDPLEGPCFEETIYVTPSRATAAIQRAIEAAVDAACRALGLEHGPVHAECRVHGDRVVVLEVAARPIGGLCARALRFRRGADEASLEDLLLALALGQSLDGWTRETDASGVMMIPIPSEGRYRGVEGVDAALAVEGIVDVRVTAKPDQHLVPLPEGASYLGFIFSRASTPDAAERALRTAHARLRFTVNRPLAISPA